jgi:hypothetical protein
MMSSWHLQVRQPFTGAAFLPSYSDVLAVLVAPIHSQALSTPFCAIAGLEVRSRVELFGGFGAFLSGGELLDHWNFDMRCDACHLPSAFSLTTLVTLATKYWCSHRGIAIDHAHSRDSR